MKIDEKSKTFLHDISNDITIAEGYVKICLSKKRTPEQKEEYLRRSLERLKYLSEKIKNYKESFR